MSQIPNLRRFTEQPSEGCPEHWGNRRFVQHVWHALSPPPGASRSALCLYVGSPGGGPGHQALHLVRRQLLQVVGDPVGAGVADDGAALEDPTYPLQGHDRHVCRSGDQPPCRRRWGALH
eukprot:1535392-Pyramimonas_sp.AAC.1